MNFLFMLNIISLVRVHVATVECQFDIRFQIEDGFFLKKLTAVKCSVVHKQNFSSCSVVAL